MSQLLAIKERLQTTLQQAAKDRDKRSEQTTRPNGRVEPAWALYERKLMWANVNKERAKLGKSRLPLEEVERVEQLAMGHVDYADKFALYCAELVVQVE